MQGMQQVLAHLPGERYYRQNQGTVRHRSGILRALWRVRGQLPVSCD
jgi:hypothetical protein